MTGVFEARRDLGRRGRGGLTKDEMRARDEQKRERWGQDRRRAMEIIIALPSEELADLEWVFKAKDMSLNDTSAQDLGWWVAYVRRLRVVVSSLNDDDWELCRKGLLDEMKTPFDTRSGEEREASAFRWQKDVARCLYSDGHVGALSPQEKRRRFSAIFERMVEANWEHMDRASRKRAQNSLLAMQKEG